MTLGVPDGWPSTVRSFLAARGWSAPRARGPVVNAVHPARGGLVVVLQILSHRFPEPGMVLVSVDAGVGVPAAMDLATFLDLPVRAGAFFARDPDGPPATTSFRAPDDGAALERVGVEAEAALVGLADRFADAAALAGAMVVQPRLRRTDLVVEQVLLAATARRTGAALDLLHGAVDRLDDTDRHDRSWRVTAERVDQRLRAWIDDGCPDPPAWAGS